MHIITSFTFYGRFLSARARIIAEVKLPDSLYECRSFSLDKHRLGKPSDSHASSKRRLYKGQYSVPYSVWPSWVHQAYDLQLLDQKLGGKTIVHDDPTLRMDPVDFSYWVVENLPTDREHIIPLL